MPATCQGHCQATIQRQDDEESERDEIGLLATFVFMKDLYKHQNTVKMMKNGDHITGYFIIHKTI